MAKSKFLKICCPRCKKCQVVYGRSSIKVKCKNCGYLLVRTSGGKAILRAIVRKIIG